MVRPRDSDEDLRQLDRRGGGELVRRSDFLDADVEQEEVKRDRKSKLLPIQGKSRCHNANSH